MVFYILIHFVFICILTGHFIRDTILILGRTLFVLRTGSILGVMDSTMCWKHSSEIIVHLGKIA